jgi:hypothetical protein
VQLIYLFTWGEYGQAAPCGFLVDNAHGNYNFSISSYNTDSARLAYAPA